jgi:hypothetical protein
VVHLRGDAHVVVLFLDGQAARRVSDAAQAGALAALLAVLIIVVFIRDRLDDDVVGVVALDEDLAAHQADGELARPRRIGERDGDLLAAARGR